MSILRPALLSLLLLLCGTAGGAAQIPVTRDVVRIPTGSTWVRYLLLKPTWRTPSTVAVVLLAGGNGYLGMTDQGTITTALAENFLVRTRDQFAQANLYVAVVDAPEHTMGVTQETRLTPDYARIMTDVIASVRSRTGAAKVWLVGTSSGTLAAASVAGIYYQLPTTPPILPTQVPNASRANGIVLTSSMTDVGTTGGTQCRVTIFDAKLANINVPAYVVADRSDTCPCTPPSRVSDILKAMPNSPAKAGAVFPLVGSSPAGTGTDVCSANTPHGFYGIEASVVSAIANWVKTH